MQEWDSIIVGGGATGCVLANRLSENPANKVLLLEAGTSNRSWQFIIPTGQASVIDNPIYDWSYQTEPDSTRYNRTETWNAGKGLGGGTAINGLLYLRGEATDFNGWEELGNKGWSYQNVLPYFRKSEDFFAGESYHHGSGGPMGISPIQYKHRLSQLFIDAAKEIGIQETQDFNTETQKGVGFYHTNQKNGRRCSTAYGYLNKIRHRKNLTIITNAFVTKLLINNKQVYGVEYVKKNKFYQVKCSNEVILCAGGIASPKILMLSGVGEKNELSQHGIDLIHELPGVGKNLQEHPAAIMNFETNHPTLYQELSGYKKYLNALRWFLLRTGPMTSPICQAAAFVSTNPQDKIPDVQIGFTPVGFLSVAAGLETKQKPMVSVYIMLMRPESRGSVSLSTKDPFVKPKIIYPCFEHSYDMETLVKACKITRSLFQTKTYTPHISKEQMPGNTVQNDEQWQDYIRKFSSRCFHTAGTCKMGQDKLAVVDYELRVHGLNGLRVADASIMPKIVSSNLTAACIMIGEKAADMILRNKRDK